MGSTARGGEKYTDQLLILLCINYRQMTLGNFAFRHIFILSGVRGTMYRDDLLSRVLCMLSLLVMLSMMYTFSSSKSTKHLFSQNMPIERSALFFKSGKMCACRASIGRVS